MADFCTVPELRAYINPNRIDPGAGIDDTQIGFAIPSATSAIVQATNRTFELQTAAADRFFTIKYPYSSNLGALAYWYPWPGVFPFSSLSASLPPPMLDVDDFFLTNQTIGQITVTDTINATTYVPTGGWPFNAASKGMPFTKLVFAQGVTLPTGAGQLKVNAKWGWINVPIVVKQAALITASRYLKRRDSPEGLSGVSVMGSQLRIQSKLDPDVAVMLSAYRRWWAAA
jgi:hypothetical protein